MYSNISSKFISYSRYGTSKLVRKYQPINKISKLNANSQKLVQNSK